MNFISKLVAKLRKKTPQSYPTCAMCGEDLLFIQDNTRHTFEVLPCICQEMLLTKRSTTTTNWISEILGVDL